MKDIIRVVILLLSIFSIDQTLNAQSIDGTWKGILSVQGTAMELVFHIKNESEEYSSTMDSPSQGAIGIPMDNTSFVDNTLTIKFEQAGFRYVGGYISEKIIGTLYQNGMEFPLVLNRLNTDKTSSSSQGYNFQEVMEERMTSNLVDRIYSREEVAEDVDFYLRTMHEVCPNPYLNSDSLQIHQIVQEIKSQGARSGRALYLDFLRLSGAFKAGHIYTISPRQMLVEHFEAGGKILPFGLSKENEVWVVDYVTDTLIQHMEGKVVHKINNIDVDAFITSFENYIHRQGDIENMIGAEISFFLYLKNIEPPFNVVCSEEVGQKQESIILNGTSILDRIKSSDESAISETLSDFITFEMLPNDIAYLNVKSMALFDEELTKAYAPFIENTFAEIEQKNAKHLIIDLRENPGGRGEFADEILPYFANTPYRQAAGETRRVSQQFKDFINEMPEAMRVASLKQGGIEDYLDLPIGTDRISFDAPPPLKEVDHKFKGKVWCLIGPSTFSAGMMMANAIEDYDLGTLVGEPTGGIPNELSDVLPVKTPNSKIAFMAPSVIFTRANGDASNPNPVLPDILVKSKEDDSTKEYDLVLDYVIDIIQNH